jgi:hypothetical protein
MNASIQRKIIRWFHIIASIPIVGYIYGPVAEKQEAVIFIRWVLLPLVVLSGFWMWQGHVIKKWIK